MEVLSSIGNKAYEYSHVASDLMSTKANPIPVMSWELIASGALNISHSEFRYVFSFFLSLAAGQTSPPPVLPALRIPSLVSRSKKLEKLPALLEYPSPMSTDLISGQQERKLEKLPSLLEYLSFVFCMGNLLGGPFLEFREYKHFIDGTGVWAFSAKQPRPSPVIPGLYLVGQALCFMCAHIILVPSWGLSNLFSDYYNAHSLLARFSMQALCGFAMQMKYYFVWKLSEASLTFAGLNLIGFETDSSTPIWGRCTNVNFVGVWFTDSARKVPQSWNIGASTFLRRYVYERISPKKGRPGFFHLLVTQLTSAFWHGLYPGYQVFFVGTAFYLNTASVIYKLEQQRFFPAAIRNASLWHVIKVVWTGTSLTYLAMSFIVSAHELLVLDLDKSVAINRKILDLEKSEVLDLDKSVAIYRDVYFIPHIIMVAFALLGLVLPRPPQKTLSVKKEL
eukprot:gene20897-27747_t